jgi:hypothetical protein
MAPKKAAKAGAKSKKLAEAGASKSAKTSTPQSCVETIQGAASSVDKRPLRRRDTDEAVDRAIGSRLSALPVSQRTALQLDGQPLREKIIADFRARRQQGLKLGPSYWADILAKVQDAVYEDLVPATKDEAVAPWKLWPARAYSFSSCNNPPIKERVQRRTVEMGISLWG